MARSEYLELPAPPADASRCPRGDRVRREPEGDVASPHEGSVVLGPVPDAIRCLVLRMHSRLHIEIMTRRRSRWSTCRPLLARRAESAHQRRGSRPGRRSRERPAAADAAVVGVATAASPPDAPAPRVPRSRAGSYRWPVREPRRTGGRCPATAAPGHAPVAGGPCALTRYRVVRGGGVMRCAGRRDRPGGTADGLVPAAPAAPDRRPTGRRRRAVPAH